jgi:DNA-binding MarR family transcriptional regulator
MSRPRNSPPQASKSRQPPFIAALLRMAYQAARRRQLKAQEQSGFGDLNQAHLNVLVYPPPDGVRPSELAERTFMTKQAMNYLLGQLEALGYIERKTDKHHRRRLVFLTRRGWRVFETQWAAMQGLEEEWAAVIGKRRFDEFMSVLMELSELGSKEAVKSESEATAVTEDLSTRRAGKPLRAHAKK